MPPLVRCDEIDSKDKDMSPLVNHHELNNNDDDSENEIDDDRDYNEMPPFVSHHEHNNKDKDSDNEFEDISPYIHQASTVTCSRVNQEIFCSVAKKNNDLPPLVNQ
eukprot:4248413-Ditylum_brightwellii.AAC.1